MRKLAVLSVPCPQGDDSEKSTAMAALAREILEPNGPVFLLCKIGIGQYFDSHLAFADQNYAIVEDWSVPFVFLYKFKTDEGESDVLKKFNLFAQRWWESGKMDKEIARWFGENAGKKISSNSRADDKQLNLGSLLYCKIMIICQGVACVGCFCALILSCCCRWRRCWDGASASKPKDQEGLKSPNR